MRVWECVQESVSGRGTRMRTPLKQRAWCVHELRTGMAEPSQLRGSGVSHTCEGRTGRTRSGVTWDSVLRPVGRLWRDASRRRM